MWETLEVAAGIVVILTAVGAGIAFGVRLFQLITGSEL